MYEQFELPNNNELGPRPSITPIVNSTEYCGNYNSNNSSTMSVPARQRVPSVLDYNLEDNGGEFYHHNQVPFISKVTQPIGLNTGRLDAIPGNASSPFLRKSENVALFQPMMNQDMMKKTRRGEEVASNPVAGFHRNALPFEQQQVAPALNQGYGCSSNDGYHSNYRVLPKNVDELRSKQNPKVTGLKGRVLRGKEGENRTRMMRVEKRRPDAVINNVGIFSTLTGYIKDLLHNVTAPDETKRSKNSNKTRTGILKKQGVNKGCVDRSSRYQFNKEGTQTNRTGNINRSAKIVTQEQKGKATSHTIRQQYSDKTISGNLNINKKNTSHHQDSAKSRISEMYEDKTYTGGVLVKSKLTNPYTDTAKACIGESYESNTKSGNLSNISEHGSLYYSDVAKSRIGESYEDKSKSGILRGNQKNTEHFTDLAKGTIRQSNESDSRLGHMSNSKKSNTTHFDDEATYTIRELTGDFSSTGTLIGDKSFGSTPFEDEALYTIRQLTEDKTYTGNIASEQVNNSNRYSDMARSTVGELTENQTRTGELSSKSQWGGVLAEDEARVTIRQGSENTKYLSGVDNVKVKNYSEKGEDAKATIRQGTEEKTVSGMTTGNNKHENKIDQEMKATIRQDTEGLTVTANVNKGQADGYKVVKTEAKATNRQDTMVLDAKGIVAASTGGEKASEQTAFKNAHTNDVKEVLSMAIDRETIEQGAKNTLDPSNINMEVRKNEYKMLPSSLPTNDSLIINQVIGELTKMPENITINQQ
jgi:hypothetical protein